jgi:hypothetical protein
MEIGDWLDHFETSCERRKGSELNQLVGHDDWDEGRKVEEN